MELTFSGSNLMNFGPAPFYGFTGYFWAYFSPIQQAIHKGNLDVSGFNSAPDPAINITSSDYPSILTTVQQTTATKVTFLGIPLASGSSETVSITLSLPPEPGGRQHQHLAGLGAGCGADLPLRPVTAIPLLPPGGSFRPPCPGHNPGQIPIAFSSQPPEPA